MALAKTRLFSAQLGMCVTCNVILPQRRDAAAGHPIPVLWLLHGAYGSHGDWITRTAIERYAAPYGLAVVMPAAMNSFYTDMAHGLKYYSYIAKELPVTLGRMYGFSQNPADHFIAGLSMGGAGSLMIGLANPEHYAAIGCFSAGVFQEEADFRRSPRWNMTFGNQSMEGTYKDTLNHARHLAQSGGPCPRIYHACGSEDHLLPCAHATRDFFQAFPSNPFDYTYVEAPGAHTWDFWDKQIDQFIQFLNLPRVEEQFV